MLNYLQAQSIQNDLYNCLFTTIEKIISKLKGLQIIDPFLVPVNTNEYDCKDYYDIIKNPISLQEITQKHLNNQYKSLQELIDDIDLMFNNSFAYNPLGTEMWGITNDVRTAYKKIMWGVGGNAGAAETWSKKTLEKVEERKDELVTAREDFSKLLKTGQLKKRLAIQYNLSKLNSDGLQNVWELIAGEYPRPREESASLKLECNLQFLDNKKVNELEKLLKKMCEYEEIMPTERNINDMLTQKIQEVDYFQKLIEDQSDKLKSLQLFALEEKNQINE